MKRLQSEKYLIRALITLFLMALVCIWIKEVTERRARQAADRFLGPTLEQFAWTNDAFIPGSWSDSKGRKHGFKWLEYYEHRFMFGEPQVVEVDLLGRIHESDNELFDDWIKLPDGEREKKQIKWSEIERRKLCPK